ncbi:heparan sulfate glucosamine 3-O-sulfotransferase 1-like [Mercenaria mercenaria]|uniref:heparan sulfate glucosamine 3-O-sulfotransferase 1-like n=1 Tax=Mercenaria mercenaria TaxID=6596 RepID=UPI00234EA902|nr:heparan sulfate glucosamine 3-O-sulfotransferase 1-like [Mercenaria mercenaria]
MGSYSIYPASSTTAVKLAHAIISKSKNTVLNMDIKSAFRSSKATKVKSTYTENASAIIRKELERRDRRADMLAATTCNCTQSGKPYMGNKTQTDFYTGEVKNDGEKQCMKKQFPKAILIGLTKGGTSALMTFLKFHPMIALRAYDPKDTKYFNHYYTKRPLDWYRNIMPCSYLHQITISKSTEYFFTPGVAERIRHFDPSMKILLMVREPIARALSQFVMWKYQAKYRIGDTSFEDAVTTGINKEIDEYSALISGSNYQRHMKAWLDNFSFNQILILDSLNFVQNPAEELNKLEDFVGVERFFTEDKFVYNATKHKYCFSPHDGSINCMGSNKGIPHPVIEKELRVELEEFFRPRNKMFFKMINRSFDWGY